MDLENLEIQTVTFAGLTTFISISETTYLNLPKRVVQELHAMGFCFKDSEMKKKGQRITLRVIYDERRPDRVYYVFLHTKPKQEPHVDEIQQDVILQNVQ